MAFAVWLKNDTLELTSTMARSEYVVQAKDEGGVDSDAAYAAARAAIPTTYTTTEGLVLPRLDIIMREKGGTSSLFVWDVRVPYSTRQSPSTFPTQDAPMTRFSTKGATQHITQSLQTISVHAPPDKTAAIYAGALGVVEGVVKGADIGVAVFQWSQSTVIPVAKFTPEYESALRELTYTVNESTFQNSPKGTVLFLGVDGQKRNDEEWLLTFDFAFKRNEEFRFVNDIKVGPIEGWQLVWIAYAKVSQADARALPPRPISAYVEMVYHYGDLGRLEIE